MPAGRPPKYETPEEMQEVIDKYFYDCKRNRLALSMEQEPPEDTITDDLYPTVTGAALCLGMTRRGLIDYENKENPEFAHTIKKAKSRIESFLEQRLFMPQPTGVIFNLKNNYGWKDKQEVEQSGPGGGPIRTDTKYTVEYLNPSDD